jgi:peptide/nickel transport system permease protein
MRAVLRRLVQLVVVLLCVSFFSFALLSMFPGDPAAAIVGFPGPEGLGPIREEIGLNDPFLVQYWHWLTGFVHGDLGYVYRGPTGKQAVSTMMSQSLPVSLQLMACAMVLTLVLAIPLGVLAAYKAGRLTDRAINAAAFGAIALPDFALAIILSYWVGVRLGWLPTSGYTHPTDDFVEFLKGMALPAISLAVGQIAAYMRLLRSDMIATLQEDYILMAKSKGIPTRRVLWRHALRPSSLTLLTVAGLNVGALIGGTIVIETIFELPGMGSLIIDAIGNRQFMLLQSCVAVIAIGYVFINFFIDILYTVLDPRIRDARAVA